jgi:hypothetical protein
MPLPTLTLQTARLMNLEAQGLLTPPPAPAVKGDVLAVIRRMGVLQIDTIHVVARSPYLCCSAAWGVTNRPGWMNCWPRGRFLSIGRMPPVSYR